MRDQTPSPGESERGREPDAGRRAGTARAPHRAPDSALAGGRPARTASAGAASLAAVAVLAPAVAGRAGRRRPAGAWPGRAVEAGFRGLARVRRAPALHPRGLVCTAELEVVDDGGEPWGAPWLDTPGRRHAATVRLSRAAGLPDRLPDALGLAVRVEQAAGPGRPLDLLLTSSGTGRITRRLPLPRTNALGGPYSSLLPYRVGDRSRTLAAFPRPVPQAPVHGDPTALAEALRAGPLVFDLGASASGRRWRTFAVLTVGAPLPVKQEHSLDFDVYEHSARRFRPGNALAATRRAAYRGSRAGRRGGPRDG